MRDINRIDKFCNELSELWKKTPDLRLGQLLLCAVSNETALFYIEEEQLIERLKNVVNEMEYRR